MGIYHCQFTEGETEARDAAEHSQRHTTEQEAAKHNVLLGIQAPEQAAQGVESWCHSIPAV